MWEDLLLNLFFFTVRSTISSVTLVTWCWDSSSSSLSLRETSTTNEPWFAMNLMRWWDSSFFFIHGVCSDSSVALLKVLFLFPHCRSVVSQSILVCITPWGRLWWWRVCSVPATMSVPTTPTSSLVRLKASFCARSAAQQCLHQTRFSQTVANSFLN